MRTYREIPTDLYPGILDKVQKSENCWEWTGTRNPNGYGTLSFRGRSYQAHRALFTSVKGKIPEGLVLDHLCRNRGCVNPEHLEIVTHKENTLRGVGLPSINAKKNECLRGHPLTKENVRTFKTLVSRQCLTCERIRAERRKVPRFPGVCEYCDSNFLSQKKGGRFCNNTCAGKWRVKNGIVPYPFTKAQEIIRNQE